MVVVRNACGPETKSKFRRVTCRMQMQVEFGRRRRHRHRCRLCEKLYKLITELFIMSPTLRVQQPSHALSPFCIHTYVLHT